MSAADIIISVVLLAAVAGAVAAILVRRHRGAGCCGSCERCSLGCQKKKENHQ